MWCLCGFFSPFTPPPISPKRCLETKRFPVYLRLAGNSPSSFFSLSAGIHGMHYLLRFAPKRFLENQFIVLLKALLPRSTLETMSNNALILPCDTDFGHS